MNQYIITEEKLVKLQGYFHEQNLVKFFEIINEVFDHLYQSERDTCPQNKIWQHCPVAEQIRKQERDKVLDVGGILESLCKTDLYWYNKGVTEGESVGKCRGKDCNYCGRYNEKLRQQAGEQ